jgi:uncharacterized membrane protein YidH (DUF202 family)
MRVPEQEARSGEPAEQGAALARFRTRLALDRTMLAWVRTALSMVGFGFGMVAFFRTLQQVNPREATQRLHELAIAFGLALLVLGVVTLALAGASHWRSLRALQRGASPGVGKWPLSLALGLLVAILGVVGLALLFSY